MFFDLCVRIDNDAAFGPFQQSEAANFLIKLGYDCVAYTVELETLGKNDASVGIFADLISSLFRCVC